MPLIHATCVALGDTGVLITGTSGSGKSGLALRLLAFGASLIADDQTEITARNGRLDATCPPAIKGRIEARRIGVLQCSSEPSTTVGIVVDMDAAPGSRLPDARTISLEGIALPLIAGREVPNLAEAILVLSKTGFAPG